MFKRTLPSNIPDKGTRPWTCPDKGMSTITEILGAKVFLLYRKKLSDRKKQNIKQKQKQKKQKKTKK